jgi:DNA mismatch endonuclease, patch repair protein
VSARSSSMRKLPRLGAGEQKGQRHHKGDFLSPTTRSAVMARIKGRGTKPELIVHAMLTDLNVPFVTHEKELPGRPDFVVREARVVILVDGDFWHGWRFDQWRMKLSEHWEKKIASNRLRDAKNRRLLRLEGWTVVRLWEHQIRDSPARCRSRLRRALGPLLSTATPVSLVNGDRGTNE